MYRRQGRLSGLPTYSTLAMFEGCFSDWMDGMGYKRRVSLCLSGSNYEHGKKCQWIEKIPAKMVDRRYFDCRFSLI